MEHIKIFDTTLRDGEQSPGASMTVTQKVAFAHRLCEMGVDIIEAGFPISSDEQFKATQIIATEVKNSCITALARAVEKDIDAAYEAIKTAQAPRIHTFLAGSPTHRKYKLQKDKSQILEMTTQAVKYARNKCSDIEFSPEDATRTELDFLAQMVETAIAAGASTINIPDTVGYTTPDEYTAILKYLFNNVSNIDKAVISTHCHDDLGLAVANTLAGVKAGAKQVEVAVNGIGERAGNAALEEVVMGLTLRSETWNATCNIKTNYLYPTSHLLSKTIGFPIPRNKAITGVNAFAHESGIHQDGVLKHRETYEIMTPQMVGRDKNSIVLGRHSGLHGLKSRLENLHIHLDEKSFKTLFSRFSIIADKKKEIYDEDLYALIYDIKNDEKRLYELVSIKTNINLNDTTNTDNADSQTINHTSLPSAEVTIKTPHGIATQSQTGDGPIDAIFKAIASACDYNITLKEFHIDAVSPGTDALGEARVIVLINNKQYTGRASSTDIIKASASAYLNAINNHILFSHAKEHSHEKQTS